MAGAALGRPFVEPLSLRGAGRLHAVTGVDEFAAATLGFPGGLTAQVSCGSSLPLEIRARLLGTAGWIDVPAPFHPGNHDLTASIVLHRAGTAPETIATGGPQSLYAVEADTVADAIARGDLESPAMSHADTLGNMAALDAWRAEVGMRYEGEN
jgi:predicted dehydrogenase